MSILYLPSEVLAQILLSTPVSSIINCAKACKHIKEVVYEDYIWKTLCETIHGVDTINQKQYDGQWRQVFIEGKAPWINLQNKRYIRKTIQQANRRGYCIELSISNEDLVLNYTAHYSGSYSPSSTLAVGIMDTHNFQVKKIEGFENKHFKKAGNYLLLFRMDTESYIYPYGITTSSFTVFKYDPNKFPTSMNDALFKVTTSSAILRQHGAHLPHLMFNTEDPELIFYASYLRPHAHYSETVPTKVEIFDLKTESATPIKSQKLLGKAFAFTGKYVAFTKDVEKGKEVFIVDWNNFTNEYDDDNFFDFDGKEVKILPHTSVVKNVLIHGDLVVCEEKNAFVIWSVQENEPKVLNRIDLASPSRAEDPSTMCYFDGKFIWAMFCPSKVTSFDRPRHWCFIYDWRTGEHVQMLMTHNETRTTSFNVFPLYTKHGNYSGKMVLNARGRTDVLYTSTPYLAKKFDVAVLTSSDDKIIAKRARTIFGHLAEDCKNLIGLSNAAALTSQVLLDNGVRRYVLVFEEDAPSNEEQPSDTPLTALLHLSVLSHHDHSPYGGLEFNEPNEVATPINHKVRVTEVSVKKLRINGACLLMKEEVSEEFGWVPVDLEHNLEQLLGDIERDMRTL